MARSVTAATNQQTQVSEDDLAALERVQRDLEAYFAAHDQDRRLYYERRSKQYRNIPIERTRIVSRPVLIRVYASMFLDEPARAGRYYKALQRSRKNDLFNEGQILQPYYTAAVAAYRLDYFFRNQSQNVDPFYKPAKYQLLMAIRHLIIGPNIPIKVKQVEKECKKVDDVLWDTTAGPALVQLLLPIIDQVSDASGKPLDRDVVKTQGFTDSLIVAVAEARSNLLSGLGVPVD